MLTRVNRVMHEHLYGYPNDKGERAAPAQHLIKSLEEQRRDRSYLDLDWLDQGQRLRGHIRYRLWADAYTANTTIPYPVFRGL